MSNNITDIIQETHIALAKLQTIVIGYVQVWPGIFELLIKANDIGDNSYHIFCLSIGKSGGISTTHQTVGVNQVHIFPGGVSLHDMLQEPLLFNEWYKTNKIK